MFCAATGGQLIAEFVGIKTSIAPIDLRVINGMVMDAMVVKRTQQFCVNTLDKVPLKHQIVITQRENIRLVSTRRSRCQTQHEARLKIVDQTTIGNGISMMEFIHHDVIKTIRCKLSQMPFLPQSLHRGKDKIRLTFLCFTGVITNTHLRLNTGKSFLRLHQNLFPVSDKQHSPGLDLQRIKSRQPGLTQSGGQHHQATSITGSPSCLQCQQCLNLNTGWHGVW